MSWRKAALALALSTLVTSPANAAWNGLTTYCGGSSFATCASVSVSSSFDAITGQTWISMTVTNLSGTNGTYGGTIFTEMGLFGLPGSQNTPSFSYVNGSLSVMEGGVDHTSDWTLGTGGLNGAGITKFVSGANTTNGINGGIPAPHGYTFTFAVTGLSSSFDPNNYGFAIHGQGGPNSCSTKLVIQSDGTTNAGPYDANCSPSVTPEPLTMTLLGTGLAGMGAASARRRRKEQATA